MIKTQNENERMFLANLSNLITDDNDKLLALFAEFKPTQCPTFMFVHLIVLNPIRQALGRLISMECETKTGDTILHIACNLSPVFTIMLLNSGFDLSGIINKTNHNGETPLVVFLRRNLSWITDFETWSVVSKLLKVGADPNIADKTGEMPLVLTLRHRRELLSVLLLSYEADVNVSVDGKSVFTTAWMNEEELTIKTLLSKGVLFDSRELKEVKIQRKHGNDVQNCDLGAFYRMFEVGIPIECVEDFYDLSVSQVSDNLVPPPLRLRRMRAEIRNVNQEMYILKTIKGYIGMYSSAEINFINKRIKVSRVNFEKFNQIRLTDIMDQKIIQERSKERFWIESLHWFLVENKSTQNLNREIFPIIMHNLNNRLINERGYGYNKNTIDFEIEPGIMMSTIMPSDLINIVISHVVNPSLTDKIIAVEKQYSAEKKKYEDLKQQHLHDLRDLKAKRDTFSKNDLNNSSKNRHIDNLISLMSRIVFLDQKRDELIEIKKRFAVEQTSQFDLYDESYSRFLDECAAWKTEYDKLSIHLDNLSK